MVCAGKQEKTVPYPCVPKPPLDLTNLGTWLQVGKVKEGLCCSVARSCLALVTLWTVARQAPLSIGFPRQKYWSGLPFPSPGNLPHPGIKPNSPALTGEFFTTEPLVKPKRGITWSKSRFTILSWCKETDGLCQLCVIPGIVETRNWPSCSIKQWSPSFLAPGTGFVANSFSTEGVVGWFQDNSSALP